MGFGQQAHTGQVQLAIAGQGLAPAPGHVGDGFRCAGQGTVQGVFGTAMDDPLGFEGLLATEAGAFHQHCRIAEPAQAGIEPEACDPSADDQHIGGNYGWHA
ncbi:hypothetical protein D9M71_693240 [compost metagenome]